MEILLSFLISCMIQQNLGRNINPSLLSCKESLNFLQHFQNLKWIHTPIIIIVAKFKHHYTTFFRCVKNLLLIFSSIWILDNRQIARQKSIISISSSNSTPCWFCLILNGRNRSNKALERCSGGGLTLNQSIKHERKSQQLIEVAPELTFF